MDPRILIINLISQYKAVIIFFFLVLVSWTPRSFASEENVVSIQLRWHHQFQFAGYYAALEKGFYRDEGLEVEIRNGDPQHQSVEEVLLGRALYAQGNSEVLYKRLQGEPLVALAAIFQHSPAVLITLKSSGIRSVHDLIGKKVMLANELQDADFLTMLSNEGISTSQITALSSSFHLNDLISGKVDAFNAYTTNEPYFLKKNNIPFNIIDPVSYRVDFYSDILFTSEEEVRNHPARVESMLRATLKGWRYAMDNPEEIIELLKTKYQVKKTRDHLRFEAEEMRKLILPDLIQIGHMNPERWQYMANTFVTSGLLPNTDHFDGFLYGPTHHKLPYWVKPILIVALIFVLTMSVFNFYLHRFNRRIALTQKTLQESEQRFKALSAATNGGIIIHDRGQILECNEGLSDITGFRYEELIGMDGLGLIAPENIQVVLEKMHIDYTDSYRVTGLRKDGSRYPLSIKGKNIIYKGINARVIEFLDISAQEKIEDQLKLAASVFTHAREGIVITDAEANIIDVNDTFTHITGYEREEVLGKNPRILKSDRHDQRFFKEMWESLLSNLQWSGEVWNKRKNGELFAELVTISAVTDTDGKTQNYVALFADITPMKHHQQQLEHIAHYDILTNLPNRMLLADRLHHSISQSERREQSLAVAYLDLDGFKTINDTYGHDVGDELLVQLSKLMSQTLREGDTLARIGGDEFVAILSDIEKMEDCKIILDRLLQAAMTEVVIKDLPLQVSTSIGVTIYPQDGVDADQLMRHADQAMYIAKQTGKNRYHLFDIYEDKSIKTQRETIEHIQRGIKQHEFVLHYQPKVNMKTGIVVGAEALIRWQHPERGLVYPCDFLAIIDSHPISLELGNWVMNTALDQMAKWQTLGLTIPISINVDAFQLQQRDFVDQLSKALAKHPTLDPHLLQLEILESSALGDIAEVLTIMNACINIGVSFSLDDFGTGFSSLTYLKRLPVDQLKIDRSFVRDMLVDPDDRAIVIGVISLASAFGRQVIAEGVETAAHGTQLLSIGCELAQGYGIARPMPAEKLPEWVAQWQPDTEWSHK